MAIATIQTAERAIAKARRVRPAVVQLDCRTWAVAGSRPGRGYIVRLGRGAFRCECEGHARVGLCYHIAAVALSTRANPDPARLARSAQAARSVGYAYATGRVSEIGNGASGGKAIAA